MTEKYVPHKDKFFSFSTIYGLVDNDKYMTRLIIGRLRLHIMYRGDDDRDCHDHPWDFTTFPLTSYVEEILVPVGGLIESLPDGTVRATEPEFKRIQHVVPAFKFTFRPAEHRHRIIGRFNGTIYKQAGSDGLFRTEDFTLEGVGAREAGKWLRRGYQAGTNPKPIITIVWRSPYKRQWGFWKSRDGKWCWQHFRDFIKGGKNAPCE